MEPSLRPTAVCQKRREKNSKQREQYVQGPREEGEPGPELLSKMLRPAGRPLDIFSFVFKAWLSWPHQQEASSLPRKETPLYSLST